MSNMQTGTNLRKNVYLGLRKYLRSYPQWRFAPPRVQVQRALQAIGSEYGGYSLDPSFISPGAVVYSLGVGEDISFDLGLIQRYGLTVHAFDPTPRVKTWLASQVLPEQFHFHDVGIADFDGDGIFYLPPRQDYISHSLIRARQYSRDSIQVPMIRLHTAMQRLGHKRIDLLKVDIEGAEYTVLQDLIEERIPVTQILVEFHHRLSSVGTRATRRMLSLLEDYGMRICHVCPRMEIFTLVRAA
ncbi:MAG TPA: FkbM family methyltransferase [Candidatus Acidoferrum sp.]|nr:FkbM family methyltransferase [Candidatus Acidoferrum sp.]